MTATFVGAPRAAEQRRERGPMLICANRKHRLIAARREAIRLRDRRAITPPGLGCLVDDHEWVDAGGD